ncbi:MAG: hypothetical protein AAGA70_09620 [Pseudomonadota bacterium]
MTVAFSRRQMALALGVAALFPLEVAAEPFRVDGRNGVMEGVAYRAPGQASQRINAVVIKNADVRLSANVSQGAIRFFEDRIATSRILGGLTRPTIRERLADAAEVGRVSHAGSTLVINVDGHDVRSRNVILAHRDTSWDVSNFRPDGASAGHRTATNIGRVFVGSDGALIALIPPFQDL